MTELTITPDVAKKRLKLAGVVASGEKVAVTIVGFGETPTANLRLRAMAGVVPVGMFPLEDEDEWTVSGANLTCTLNLATEQAERHCAFGAEVCFILEDTGTPQLYGGGLFELRPWVKLAGDDVPVNLADYRTRIAAIEAAISQNADAISAHEQDTGNPHGVTKAQVGLGNVDNTADMDKPVSNEQQAAINEVMAAVQAEAASRAAGDAPLSGQTINTNTANAMRQAIKTIGAALGATMRVVAACAALPLFGASVQTAPLGELDLDTNPRVVTNVDLSGLLTEHQDISGKADKTNTYTKGETDARIVELSPPAPPETDPHFSTFTNEGGRLLGPLRISQREDFDYVDTIISSNGVVAWRWYPSGTGGGGAYQMRIFNWWDVLTSESDPSVPSWARASSKPTYTATEVGAAPASHATDKSNPHEVTASQVGAPTLSMYSTASNLAANANTKADTAIMFLQGDDVNVVITNYDSQTTMPSMSIRQRIEEDGSNYWKVVWNELTRWMWLTDTYLPTNYYNKSEIDTQMEGKADRAFGFYDSHTGGWAPDGYMSISAPKILIAKDMAYQRHLSTDGAIWVLESNGLVTEVGGVASNGFFRISDDEGAALFEIVKGNKRTIGSSASGITTEVIMGITHCYIPYNVESPEHPTIYATTTLGTPFISEESSSSIVNVTWTGATGAWRAEVWPKTTSSSLFVKAEHEVGGETYIKNAAPTDVSGGILCTDGIHKVRPVYNNGTVTWEVVQ